MSRLPVMVRSRPGGIHGLAGFVSLVATVLLSACSTPKPRPNVVLIVVDDLRADHVGSYGYERDTTPFVDRLAEEGVLFENVVSQSSWTKTSMASMMTSLYPDAHGVRTQTDVLAESLSLLPEILAEHGYRTLGVTGNPWLEAEFGFDQGFEYYVFSHWHNEDMSGQRVVREAVKWLRAEPREPFFLYLHFMDVHAPFEAPEGFDMYGSSAEDQYDGSIRYVDAQLDWLYDKLGELDLLEDTWFVFTSDHGEEFWEHGRQGHAETLYDEVVKVPLIVHHRDLDSAGARVRARVRLIDVAPTLLDVARVEIPDGVHGVSLRTSFGKGSAASEGLDAYSRVRNENVPGTDFLSLSSGGFKFVLNLETGEEELYDLIEDPGEKENLATTRPEKTAVFRQQLSRYAERMESIRPDSQALPELDEDLKRRLRALGYLK